MIFGFENKA